MTARDEKQKERPNSIAALPILDRQSGVFKEGGGESPMAQQRTYIAIDLKSFYASVECAERGLDPLTNHLVVADQSRTDKTICLAVSPSLKALGIPGRPRLFEVVEAVKTINARRLQKAPGHRFSGASHKVAELAADPSLALDYIVAKPRMAYYIQYSTGIYNIYLRYVAPEDIHIYSVDEVFMDVTDYLSTYGLSARELCRKMIGEVLHATGITATAGIGSNLYLCKIAMDIVAKHMEPDEQGVRIAELDEESYRRLLWTHRPLTDFWRVGHGIRDRLESLGLYTMGDVARCSLGKPGEFYNEDLLYKTFGINAELLIDHAWGYESCTMADIKAYRPEKNSLSVGQVLAAPYDFEKGLLIVREMAESLAMQLLEKGLVTDQVTLTVGFDRDNIRYAAAPGSRQGPVTEDRYGRSVPKHAHGSEHLPAPGSSLREITRAAVSIYRRCVSPRLLVRRLNISAENVLPETQTGAVPAGEQMDLFSSMEQPAAPREDPAREKRRQEAVLAIRQRYGKNAIVKGMDLEEGATAMERNQQIGGHKA